MLKTEVKFDNDGNKTVYVYQNEALISEQVTTSVPTSNIPMSEDESQIIQIGNSSFYLINYKDDFIQKMLLISKDYFSKNDLNTLSTYLDKNSVVIDIGANIGNHTLYFANECHVKKVYAFEPVPYTFEILKKNIELNHLEDKTEIYCVGLSDANTNAVIEMYDLKNLGGTRIKSADDGGIKLVTLDSINIKEKISLIKIDVETMEYKVLCGAQETIKKHKPILTLESFDQDFERTDNFVQSLGYKLEKKLGCCDYLYIPN